MRLPDAILQVDSAASSTKAATAAAFIPAKVETTTNVPFEDLQRMLKQSKLRYLGHLYRIM